METYNGHVKTPADAIILFEACRIGLLPRVQRRLSEKERQQIKSGSVFVWDEREAGMRRWTDGKSWSASRVSGSFLTYREMEGKRGGNGYATTPQPPQKKPSPKVDGGDSEEEGPDGYRYKPDGLMKQSFSITTSSGQHLHLISYYARSSPSAPNLLQPSTDPNLRHIRPPKNMYPESTVNDPQVSMPAVTRAPMPSPHFPSGSPQPMAGSPYQRPPPMGPTYVAQQPGWPPTPSATPPGAYAVYYPYGPPPPGHAPMHFQPIHHGYPQHIGPPTHLDRVPPTLQNSQMPPAPYAAHGHPHNPPYPHNITTRAPPASYPAPLHYPPTTEPGPQLPPVGIHAGGEPRRPGSGGRPPPSSLAVPETTPATSSVSPARAGPVTSLSSILNSAPHNIGSPSDNSRQGSQSPPKGPYARKMNESTAPLRAANQAINALNSAALST